MNPRLYAAEYVFPGHPDKLCDAIADALVAEAARLEQRALVGVEVAVHRNKVFVTGRIACRDAETIDVPRIVRNVFASAGYDESWYPAPSELEVHTDLCLGPLLEGESEFRGIADDQSIVTGYAVDLPGTNYLPPEHWLAWRLAQRFQRLRQEHPELQLGPDGKLIVVYEDHGNAARLSTFSASIQQEIKGDQIGLHRAVLAGLKEELELVAQNIPGFDPAVPEVVVVNGAGNFCEGGPEGDNGLSGKKLVVDAYGPRVPIGGGALSGKDFYKADRAGAIIARRLAKAVVMTGASRECTVQLAFVPGSREAELLSLRTEGETLLDVGRWAHLVERSLNRVGDAYTGISDLVEVAREGHFTELNRPWEEIYIATSSKDLAIA